MRDISVIVPFYHGNKYMGQLMNCLYHNQLNLPKDWSMSVILVNDSVDDYPVISEEYATKLNLRIINNPHNVGIHQSRINGIISTDSEYILMLDQDDILLPHALALFVTRAFHADAVYSNAVVENGGPSHKHLLYRHAFLAYFARHLWPYTAKCNQIISPGQVLLRRAAVPKEWMRYAVKRNGADDELLWMLMLSQGKKFVYINKVLYIHCDTGENVSKDERNMDFSVLEILHYLYNVNYFSKHNYRVLRRRVSFDLYRQKGTKVILKKSYLYLDVIAYRCIIFYVRALSKIMFLICGYVSIRNHSKFS